MYEKIIVAVDFGTSKITAVAAKKNERDILSVMSVESADSNGSILRGRIYNQEEVILILNRLIATLNRKHNIKIEKIVAGGGGQSVRSVPFTIERELTDESEVSQKLLDSMLEECLNYEPDGGAVLGALSPEYSVDGRKERNPRGVQCRKIEATYQLIVGRPSLEKSLYEVAKKADVSLAGIVSSVEAVAEAVLTSYEMDMGCVLINFGAGITELSIYKNRLLQFFVTIPLGSEVITKDLTSLNMTQEEAEEYKVTQGCAIAAEGDEKNKVVEARLDEMLTNIMVQLKRSGFEQMPSEGIVITGGAALLKELPKVLRDRMKCKVRLANPKDSLFIQEAFLNSSPEYALVSGLLLLGKENCAQVLEKQGPPPVQSDLFGNTQQAADKEKEEKPKEEKPREERPKKQEEKKQNKEGLFERLRNKVGKGVEGVSKSLFDDEI